MKTIQEIAKELHQINFDGVLRTKFNQDGDYTYKDWKPDGHQLGSHQYADVNPCCCDLCEKYKDCVLADGAKDKEKDKDKDKVYKFTLVSHGTHTVDFLEAHDANISKIADWSTKPVMFVMENPANGKKERYVEFADKTRKRLPVSWYWLDSSYNENEPDQVFEYPNYFEQRKKYGKLVYSIVNTFKIANGYVTNMVKCGVGYFEGKEIKGYRTTEEYNPKIVENCIRQRLIKELNALRRKEKETVLVFAFANNTFNSLKKYLKEEIEKNEIKIYYLPHPNSHHLTNDARKYELFGTIRCGLLQTGFYDAENEFVPLKPDFEQILARDNEKQDGTFAFEKQLLNFSYENKPIRQQKEYTHDTLEYNFPKEGDSVTFRYYDKNGVDYKSSWVEYKFENNTIRLFVGKSTTANKQVTENFTDYWVYRAMIEFLKTKLNIEITARKEEH